MANFSQGKDGVVVREPFNPSISHPYHGNHGSEILLHVAIDRRINRRGWMVGYHLMSKPITITFPRILSPGRLGMFDGVYINRLDHSVRRNTLPHLADAGC